MEDSAHFLLSARQRLAPARQLAERAAVTTQAIAQRIDRSGVELDQRAGNDDRIQLATQARDFALYALGVQDGLAQFAFGLAPGRRGAGWQTRSARQRRQLALQFRALVQQRQHTSRALELAALCPQRHAFRLQALFLELRSFDPGLLL